MSKSTDGSILFDRSLLKIALLLKRALLNIVDYNTGGAGELNIKVYLAR